MSKASEKRARLAKRVRQREFIVAPGIYEMISALIADQMDFNCLYMTGYGTVASYMGLPDAGLASYADMLDRASAMAETTATPLIADADTGYGGLLNVHHTVQGYERAGISGIQLEDQEFPKKCGHTVGRRVIPINQAVRKIEVACKAREHSDFLIVARTDARTSLGIEEALARARAFEDAGADVIFVESLESEDEFEQVGKAINSPLLANMVEGGRSPILSKKRLTDLGFTIAIYPATGFCAAAHALRQVYETLKTHGTSSEITVPLYGLEEMHTLLKFEEVWDFEKNWVED